VQYQALAMERAMLKLVRCILGNVVNGWRSNLLAGLLQYPSPATGCCGQAKDDSINERMPPTGASIDLDDFALPLPAINAQFNC
jgi:hypothetical protein